MHPSLSRRRFLRTGTAALLGAAGCAAGHAARPAEPPAAPDAERVIDIHQHCNYGGKRNAQGEPLTPGRTDAELLAHQRTMGITQTILLPAGTPVKRPSTHDGVSNCLLDTCAGVDACRALAAAHPGEYYYAANEVPDLPGAAERIEAQLKAGAVAIAEQKFGVDCDAPEMQTLYRLAAAYQVPILMHWQFGRFNAGFDRFPAMLGRHPKTLFIGHAQTLWAHVGTEYQDDARNLYPKGAVTPGGWTDRYLRDYPNFYADLSAGSGLNALTRDPDFTRAFLTRHQDKLIYGSDCSDRAGAGAACSGAQTLQQIRTLAGTPEIRRKLLAGNARRVFRI